TAELHRNYVDGQSAMYRRFLASIAERPRRSAPMPKQPIAGPPSSGKAVPAPIEASARKPFAISRRQLELLASERVSDVLGPLFECQDGYARQVRMPEPPLLLVDRVVDLIGTPGTMGRGRIVTE